MEKKTKENKETETLQIPYRNHAAVQSLVATGVVSSSAMCQ